MNDIKDDEVSQEHQERHDEGGRSEYRTDRDCRWRSAAGGSDFFSLLYDAITARLSQFIKFIY
jgi:hypothetical protein